MRNGTTEIRDGNIANSSTTRAKTVGISSNIDNNTPAEHSQSVLQDDWDDRRRLRAFALQRNPRVAHSILRKLDQLDKYASALPILSQPRLLVFSIVIPCGNGSR